MAHLLPTSGFSMRAEPGRREALLGAHRVSRGDGSTPGQLADLGVEVGLQPGAVVALEGPQVVDLFLQDALLLAERTHDLGVPARRVAFQRRGLGLGLARD